jgi:hypothetical protein
MLRVLAFRSRDDFYLQEYEKQGECYELAPHIPEDSMDLYRPIWTLEVT